jgi:hypothetical protein
MSHTWGPRPTEAVEARAYHAATHCAQCAAEAPLDPDGLCDYCSIESSEAEHEANNAAALSAVVPPRAWYAAMVRRGRAD